MAVRIATLLLSGVGSLAQAGNADTQQPEEQVAGGNVDTQQPEEQVEGGNVDTQQPDDQVEAGNVGGASRGVEDVDNAKE